MTSISPSLPTDRVHQKEFDDPHYHDEDLEVPVDDRPPLPGTNAEVRKEALRKMASRQRASE
jgi:hypothetical protein